jgi:quercetin dioxygenase-like cupin family protein
MKLATWMATSSVLAWCALASAKAPEIETAPRAAPVVYLLKDAEGVVNGRAGRLKADGDSTRGAYSLVVRGPYSSPGPEAHTHSHLVEAWLITEGALKFQTRERVLDAPAGSFVLVPPGVEHRFWTEPGQQVKVVQLISPPGFEKFLDERFKLPGYDPARTQAEQSAAWKRAAEELAGKYGGGAAEVHSDLPPRVIGPEEGWASASPKDRQRVLADFTHTGGGYQLIEHRYSPGKALPWISATQDEAFYVVSGSFTVQLRDRRFALVAGDFLFLPRKTEHRLRITSRAPANVLVLTSRSS